jgi:integrase
MAAMIAAAEGQGTRAIRDRAILALGLAAALRRSELVALEWRDVEMVDKGLKLTLRHSKTDQEGEGQVIAVPSGKTLKPVSGSRPGWRCGAEARVAVLSDRSRRDG